jgi:hypothetical protein
MVNERLSRVELIQVHVPESPSPNPWLAIAGTWRDNPDIDQVPNLRVEDWSVSFDRGLHRSK